VQPDNALFSNDYRAAERLFCLLMQAAGRAGRDAHYLQAHGSRAEMWIQTRDPQHAVFTALRNHDYPEFAAQQLQEREDAGMPPFSYQALVRADARSQEDAQAFLRAASQTARDSQLPDLEEVFMFPPIPMAIQRVANVERAQMLLESLDRNALQRFLHAWQPLLHGLRAQAEHRALVRWLVDVDPLGI
jgi:primosomal protein N' (replication factor Y)